MNDTVPFEEVSRWYPKTTMPTMGIFPRGSYCPGTTRPREPMHLQTYMRKSRPTSFMNLDTDGQPEGLKRASSAPSLKRPMEEQFRRTAEDFGATWGVKRGLADWRCSLDKKMFDPRASGPRVL